MAWQGLGIEPQPPGPAAFLGTLGQGLGQIGQQVNQQGAQQANLGLALRQQQLQRNQQTIQNLGLITQLPPEYRAVFAKQMEGQVEPGVLDLMKKLDSEDAKFIFNHKSVQDYINDPASLARAPLRIQQLMPAMIQLHQYKQMQEFLKENSEGAPGAGSAAPPPAPPAPPQPEAPPAGLGSAPAPPGPFPGVLGAPGGGAPPSSPGRFQPLTMPAGGQAPPAVPPVGGAPAAPAAGGGAPAPQAPPPIAGALTGTHESQVASLDAQIAQFRSASMKADRLALMWPGAEKMAAGYRAEAQYLQGLRDKHAQVARVEQKTVDGQTYDIGMNAYGVPVTSMGPAKQNLQAIEIAGPDGLKHRMFFDSSKGAPGPNNPLVDGGLAEAGSYRQDVINHLKDPKNPYYIGLVNLQRPLVSVPTGTDVYGVAGLVARAGGGGGAALPGAAPGTAPPGPAPAPTPAAPPSGAPAPTVVQGPNGLTATVTPRGSAPTPQGPASAAAGPQPLISRAQRLPEAAVKDLSTVGSYLEQLDALVERAPKFGGAMTMYKFATAPTIEHFTKKKVLSDDERDFSSRIDRLKFNVDRSQAGLSAFRSPAAIGMLNAIVGTPYNPGLDVRLKAVRDQLRQEYFNFRNSLQHEGYAVPPGYTAPK